MTRRPAAVGLCIALVLVFAAGGAGAQSGPSVGDYTLVGSTRVTRTVSDFTYQARLSSPLATPLAGVRATLTSLSPATVVMDGVLEFGDVPAGAVVTSLDTFTIRQDRTVLFDPANLVWTITFAGANGPPTASAGLDQTVTVGTTVQLDGSASTDPDGNSLTFGWHLLSMPAGSGAVLSDPTALRPTFLVDRPGTYVAKLVVNDGSLDSAPDTVQVSTLNSRPVAGAGPDQTVPVGALVTLDGTGSGDVDGDPLSLQWAFVERPEGSAAALDDPGAPRPSFTADLPGRYVVRLVVNDGVEDSVPDTVQVDTLNSPPVARAGGDITGTVGVPVTLDGRGSTDADGDGLTYRWAFTTRPEGSVAAFDDAALAEPTVIPDVAGDYVAQLIVSDGVVDSAPDTVVVTVGPPDQPPGAEAGPDQTVARGVTVRLDGGASSDPEGMPLTFAWTLLSRPTGSAAALVDPATATPTFVADVNGTYVARLVVSDGSQASAPDTVTVTVEDGADLRIFFEIAPAATPAVGGTISMLLRIDNLGPAAVTGVAAHVPIPAGYTFVSSSLGVYDSLSGVWSIASLSPSSFGRLGLTLRVRPTGPYDLTATITGSSRPDPNPASNTAMALVMPNPNADLHIFVEIPPPATAAPGDLVSILLRISNLGPAATTGVSAHVPIPAGYTLQSSGLGIYDAATGVWTIASLSGSGFDFGRLSLSLRVNATGSLELTGTITGSSQPDPDLANNTVTAPRVNRPPVASAGADQSVATGATVTLDASLSGDADGDPLAFAWAFTQRAANSTATLSGADTASPSFVADQPGTYLVQLTARDSSGVASTPDSVAITAVVENRPPVILSVPVTAGAVGEPYRYDVHATDPDAGDTLTYSLATAPAGLTIDPATGAIAWTPVDGQGGPQAVTVRVQDQGGLAATQHFAVQVSSAANRAPVAADDAYAVRISESLSVPAPGVMANDADADGAALTATLVESPVNGTLLFNPDGSFTYTPHTLTEGNLVRLSNVNLATRIPGVTATASSEVSPAAAAIDDAIGSAWRGSAAGQPFFDIGFPQDVTVTRLELLGSRTFAFAQISAGIFQLFDASGAELFTSGNVDIPPPNRDVTVHVPSLAGVRRVRLTPTARAGTSFEVSIEELKVFGTAVIPRAPAAAEPNLTQLLPTQVNASSFIAPNVPEAVIDDSAGTNWFAGSFGAGEFLELVFPVDVTVTEIRAEPARGRPDGFGTSLLINQCTGSFALLDAAGTVLLDSGVVNAPFQQAHPHGGGIFETFVLSVPDIPGVRRVRYTTAGCVGGSFPPGFEELRVLGTAPVSRPAFRLARKIHALPGREIHSTPLVVSLTDDNADGRVDRNDVPDIVLLMESIGNQLAGEIKVLSGDDGRELGTLGAPDLISPWSEAAAGDIDGDGVPDVVAVHSGGNHLMAFDMGSGGVVSGNLAQLLLPLTFSASPSTNNVFPPQGAVDGSLTTSWATSVTPAPGVPFFELEFPVEATVTELQLVADRAADRSDFLTGIFQLLSTDGTVLFDSGGVALPAPDHDIVMAVPGIVGVRRVRFTGTTRESGGLPAGIAELRVMGSAAVPAGLPRTKWISDANPMPRFAIGASTVITGAVAIANLDAAGPPEIIVGASVFDSNGRLLGDGRTLGGTTGGTGLRSAISAVADLDLDGVPELVAGPTAYRLVNGQLTRVWQRTDRADGYVAIGNFDSDPFPEIVVVACPPDEFSRGVCAGQGQVYMLDHDGSDAAVWNPPSHAPVPIPGGGQGGAPTIADVDGDGVLEIGVAGAVYYTVFDRDGTVRWKSAIRDRSSSATGSTVFDFDGDGGVEVVYRDELFLRVYRGSDGLVLARVPISSSTWSEQPVVADVDNDGRAELVVVGDPFIGDASRTGVHVFEDPADQWTRTRRIWNQHTYHVTNVDEDGQIPRVETPHWLVPGLNQFRLNAFAPGESVDTADSFTYQLTDGALLSNVATARVAIRPRNSAPRLVSIPVTTAATGVRYTYAAQATDPDAGDILTFSLTSAPGGMTIDPLSGLIQWTPSAGQLGGHDVVVRVQDSRGLFALQGYSVQVASPVTVPDVLGQPQTTAATAITGAGLVVGTVDTRTTATIPAGAVLGQHPAGGTLAAPGAPVNLVLSLGPPPVGTVPLVLGLPQGAAEANITAAGFAVGAAIGRHDPATPLGLVLEQSPAAGTVAPTGVAVSLVVSLGVPPGDRDLDGDGVTGNQGDCDDTSPAIRPGAVDVAGNGLDENCNGVDSIAGDETPPTARIDSPGETDILRLPIEITGVADDPNFLRYTITVEPVNGGAVATVASGSAPVSGVLGRLDSTLLENGLHRVRLTVEDVNGQRSVEERVYQVNGAKIGHARLSFTDLTVPVAGVPIAVVRTFDSRVRSPRDFGLGWSLDVRQGSYQNNRDPGSGWRILASAGPLGLPCQVVEETRFHVTQVWLSDREFYTFKLALSNPAPVVGGCVAEARFAFLDGSTPGATLEALGATQVLYTAGDDVRAFDGGEDTGVVYRPDRVRLTTRDRRVIELDRALGITRVADANGNTLTIGAAGIVHGAGRSVAFERDAAGRITRITGPDGARLGYAYDAAGRLASFQAATGEVITYRYDAADRLERIENALGHVLFRGAWDEQGRLIATQDAEGNGTDLAYDLDQSRTVVTTRTGGTLTYRYDARGNVTSRTDALGGTSAFTYGPFDTLLSKVDALGNTTILTYDGQGNLLTRRDPLGNVTSYTYDDGGRILTTTDPLGRTTTNTYDARGNLLTRTDPAGNTWRHEYDGQGSPILRLDPAGNATVFAYDLLGRLTLERTPCGGQTWYEYDAAGRRVQTTVVRTLGPGGPVPIVTRYEYDASGRPLRTIDPAGFATARQYDPAGNLQRTLDRRGRPTTYAYTRTGRVAAVTAADGATRRYTYDADGRLLTVTDPVGRIITHGYDALGRLVRIVAPDGSTTTRTWDAAGRLTVESDALGRTTTHAYDAAGRRLSTTDPLGQVTRHTYDAAGRLTSTTDAAGRTYVFEYGAEDHPTAIVYPDGTSTRFTRDFAGRVTSTQDQAGLVTRYGYDACGRLVSVTDPLGQVTTYTYDEVGNRVSQTDPDGRVTRWAYDAQDRLVGHTLPLGMSERFAYDPAGALAAWTDFAGQTTSYTHDAVDRLLGKVFPDGSSVSFTYTPAGERLTATDVRGVTSYTYDARGRLGQVVDPYGVPVTYAYDAAGNRVGITTPAGTTAYAYDALNRLTAVTEPDGARTAYGYDPAGNLLSVQYPNGTREDRTYDALSRLVGVEHRGPGDVVIGGFAYTLGPAGNRLRVVEQSSRTVDYAYDALYRLVEERIGEPGGGLRTIAYGYDRVGNRLTRTDSGGAPAAYAYDANDRLVLENGQAFTYDPNGRLLRQPDGTTYAYDAEHRLLQAETPTGTVRYAYDADGHRVETAAGGATTRYLVDTGRRYAEVLEERDAAGTLLAANVLGHALLGRRQGATRAYYHHDGQRSVRALTDSAGTVTDRYTYDAFGVPLAQAGTSPNPYRYAGEALDALTGQYYLRARYYQPGLGRFSTMDPLAALPSDPRSLHRYVYALNDPVNRRDPSGESSLAESMISVAIVGVLSTLALPGCTPPVPTLQVDFQNSLDPRYPDQQLIRSGAKAVVEHDFEPYNVKVMFDCCYPFRTPLDKIMVVKDEGPDHIGGQAPLDARDGRVYMGNIMDRLASPQFGWSTQSPNYADMATALGNVLSHEAGHLYGIDHPPASAGIMRPRYLPPDLRVDQAWDQPSQDKLQEVLGLRQQP